MLEQRSKKNIQELKELKRAKEYLEKTVKIQPNYAFAHFSLGNLQKELKEFKKNYDS